MINETNSDLSAIQQQLWATEQEILDVIDSVCQTHNLRYSLAYGTLLGAVRHGGFIPWDDDVDVMMPREDYEKLIEIWPASAPEGFLMETEQMSDDYVNNFLKIRKEHTTFLQFESERTAKHLKGIYVDVFPADRRAPGRLSRAIQYAAFAVNLLFNRGYRSGSGGLIGAAEKVLLRMVPKRAYRKISDRAGKISRRWNGDDEAQLIFPCTIRDCRRYYPSDLFSHLELIPFNGKNYYAYRDREQFLTIRYGDFMQLPPEEERVWKHHPILIDFTHNYEELKESN